jgi:hypothetical protein
VNAAVGSGNIRKIGLKLAFVALSRRQRSSFAAARVSSWGRMIPRAASSARKRARTPNRRRAFPPASKVCSRT